MPITTNTTPIESGSIELQLVGGEVSTVLYALAHAHAFHEQSGATAQCEGLAVRIETAPRDPRYSFEVLSIPLLADEIVVVQTVVAEIAEMFRSSKSPDMALIYEHVLAKIAAAPRR